MADHPDHDDDGVTVLPQLRQVLSPGYEVAQAELDAVFHAAREQHPGNPYLPGLEEWLSTVLAAEYFGLTPQTREQARPEKRGGTGKLKKR